MNDRKTYFRPILNKMDLAFIMAANRKVYRTSPRHLMMIETGYHFLSENQVTNKGEIMIDWMFERYTLIVEEPNPDYSPYTQTISEV